VIRYFFVVVVFKLAAIAGMQKTIWIRIPATGIHANKFLRIKSSHQFRFPSASTAREWRRAKSRALEKHEKIERVGQGA
jgi:hypothetical protein